MSEPVVIAEVHCRGVVTERYFGVPGHCFDIDGEWWHEPGQCKGAAINCNGKCCGTEPVAAEVERAEE